jgi:glycogen debranching enzyme
MPAVGRMVEELVVLDGSTFFVTRPSGDVDTAAGAERVEGLFHSDVRHLARWSLLVDGRPIEVLTTRNVDYYSARVVGTPAGSGAALTVRRERIVADGVHEDIWVENHSDAATEVELRMCFAADFVDLLELKYHRTRSRTVAVQVDGSQVMLWYDNAGYRRSTTIIFDEPGSLGDDAMFWRLRLEPRGTWQTCIDVRITTESGPVEMRTGHGGMGMLHPSMRMSLAEWIDRAPALHSDADALCQAYQQSLLNLAALRFHPQRFPAINLPAAGLPWFMALFGRDSLLTAYQALPFHPSLARDTLRSLAALQATEYDDFRDAEPGKIPHELRDGEGSSSGRMPHTPYYGGHDATPLFLILLDEYEQWTGDTDLVRQLEGAARAALAWIEGPGDPDQDGFLEYRTRSPEGLRSQCWKDSWNSILFADGRLAEPPIATCEIQGYAHDARRRTARLAREVWGDDDLAARLDRDAAALRERFHRDFWLPERGHYALALDRDKTPVDALTSNTGHLLWSGIIDDKQAARVVHRLMAEDMNSGWGIRTMSTKDGGYSPIEYHNGTVWPHDTALIAEGMRRYGYRDQAAVLVLALLEAAGYFDHLLPEVFGGYPRKQTSTPVEYPTACRPQAWAVGAPLLGLRTLLGLDIQGTTLATQPHIPAELGSIQLDRIPVRGQYVRVG